LAEQHRMAPALMVIQLGLGVLRQAAGEWDASEDALRRAEAVQSMVFMAGAGITGVVRATALYARGRLGEAEPQLRTAASVHPAMRDLHVLAVLAAGRRDEARILLGPWREQPVMIWDYLWVTHAVIRSFVWVQLGDAEAVAELRAQLEPFADRVADGAMAAAFLGSVRHALAALALAQGDLAAARTWATEARDLHRRVSWAPWERLSQELLDRVPVPQGTHRCAPTAGPGQDAR
jgi:hypothetical protein